MQQQLAEMTAQLHALQTEHNKLTGKNVVLEKVLRSRQSQLQILQDQRKVHALAAILRSATPTQPPFIPHGSSPQCVIMFLTAVYLLLNKHFLCCQHQKSALMVGNARKVLPSWSADCRQPRSSL